MFNKLFAKILDSSVWLEDDPTVRVWFTLMAAMDEDGFAAFSSDENLASRAFPMKNPKQRLAETKKAVELFLAPDPNSSNPDHEGRRIERVPGGYLILNAKYYRDLYNREREKQLTRERVRRHRERNGALHGVTDCISNGTPSVTVTPSEAEAEAEGGKGTPPSKQASTGNNGETRFPRPRRDPLPKPLYPGTAKDKLAAADEQIREIRRRAKVPVKGRTAEGTEVTTYQIPKEAAQAIEDWENWKQEINRARAG